MSATKTTEWKGVTGGKTLGQKGLLFLFHWFNVTIGYFFLAFTVPFYMLFARKRYLAIYRYFRKHFSYSPLKAFYKTYKNHFVFGKCMLDRFAVYAGRKNFFHVEITGNDHFIHLLDEKRGFIIASSHVGNFELSGYLLKQDKKRINALIFSGEAEEVMKNRTKILNANNISVIPVLNDMSHLFTIHDALSNGDIVNMPCDRMFGSDKSVECEFLSGKADFPIGAFTLAVHFNVPVIANFVMKKSATNYHIYVKPVSLNETINVSKREKIELLTRQFVKQLEEVVCKYPEQWFNFYDFWKEK